MISSGGYAVVSSFGQYLAVGVFVWRNNDLISVSVSVCRKLDIVGFRLSMYYFRGAATGRYEGQHSST